MDSPVKQIAAAVLAAALAALAARVEVRPGGEVPLPTGSAELSRPAPCGRGMPALLPLVAQHQAG